MKVHRNEIVAVTIGNVTFLCLVLAIHSGMLTVAKLGSSTTGRYVYLPKWVFTWYQQGFSCQNYYVQTITSFDLSRVSAVVGKVKYEKMGLVYKDVMRILSRGEDISDWFATMDEFNTGSENGLYTPVSMTDEDMNSLKGMTILYDFGYKAVGCEEQKCRPAIVLQEVEDKCIVAPVSHRVDDIPFHIQLDPECSFTFSGLDVLDGSILLEHVRTIKKKDIIMCTGLLNSSVRNTLNRELFFNSIRGLGYPFPDNVRKLMMKPYLKKEA